MQKVIVAIALAIPLSASAALSEGQAALIGGVIGYGIRAHNTPSPQPQYIQGYPVQNQQIIIQQGQPTQIISPPHVNDVCSTVTIINGEYNPGKAQWACRYGR